MAAAKNIFRETLIGEKFPELESLPFAGLLPTTYEEMLKVRLYVRERCLTDLEFRKDIDRACSKDIVLFANLFVFFVETRETEDHLGKFPIVLWPDQQDILAAFQKYVGLTDITVDKTRGIGLSYLLCLYLIWALRYKGTNLDFGVVSKDTDSLDLKGRPGTLMGKLDVIWADLPAWMTHDENGASLLSRTASNTHKFLHLGTNNAITGFAATDQKLRSWRGYALFSDESAFFPFDVERWLAAAHGATPSIIYISTHNGTSAFFYRLCKNTVDRLVRISTYWQNNVRCRKGLYKVDKGQVHMLDPDYDYGEVEFQHDLPGRLRSPWVDRVFARPGASFQAVLEEIYGIAAVDSRKLFRDSIIDAMNTTSRVPLYRGDVSEDGHFTEDLEGEVHLFQVPGTFNSSYSVGCDPAPGLIQGAFSGLCVTDKKTGEVVLTARLSRCDFVKFARLTVGICKFLVGPRGFGYARVNHETTGVNAAYTNEMKRLRYPALYEEDGKIGYHNTDRGEAVLIELGRAVRDREFFVIDERLADELSEFEYTIKQELIYAGIAGHGDLAIAAALSWHGAKAQRRVYVDATRPAKQTTLPPEKEPKLLKMRRQGEAWSSQFETQRTRFGV